MGLPDADSKPAMDKNYPFKPKLRLESATV
jgi:hypothetical protein